MAVPEGFWDEPLPFGLSEEEFDDLIAPFIEKMKEEFEKYMLETILSR